MSKPKDFLNMAELDADRLELLEYLLEEEGVEGASPADRISPRETRERLPLSFAQQRLWFLEQLEPGSPAYHIAGALRMLGRLDAAALRRSLNEIVRRHESLRTSFVVKGRPEQVVAPDCHIALPVEDLSVLAAAEREAEMRRLSREEAQRPFDLSRSPLWRARLLRMGGDEHVLLLTMHHIISDGWSSGVMVRELAALYEAYAGGGESPLEELGVQYGDYALWQREQMTGEALETQLAYWRRQLSGDLPVLELPTRRARASVQTFRAASHTQALPEKLSEELKELSLREDATLFMTLLAALQVLLSRHGGQADVLVGTPVAGRTRAETEPLIGCFVNTLVLRARVDERRSFRELLARVRDVCLEAYAHQEVPFEKLVEELHPERSLSRTPLFQVMFTLQNTPMPVVELSGLKLSLLETDTEAAQFDLALEVAETPWGLKTLWRYNRDLFDAATIECMAEQFRALLEGVAADCGARVAELSMLTERESGRLLSELNETATDYPRRASIHELFERRAGETPDAVALSFEGERLTYGELNRRANRLAHYLINMGVGPEMCVGVMLERSVEMIVGLLGVLKAGGAYVPLDPAYPPERLAFMVEDAMILVLLTEERHLDSAFAQQVVCLDGDWELIAAESTENPPSRADAESLAYVIYTSGSTGRPKGVCVTHRAVVRLVCRTNYADFSPGDVFLQLAPVTFDASTFEIWGALLCGARLALMPPGVALTEEIGAAVVRHGVTTLWLTAGLFQLMVDERLEDLRGLRHLLAGGDVLSVRHVNRFVGECGGRLTNGYGPTENTTFTCCHRVEREEHGASVPIGRPVSNTRVYVLDERMRPVGTGVVGELYAGGDGLARCYLNRPELTAEKFVPDPFGGEAGARLYRTGDLARHRPDGTIEFVGRRDQQVKLRGFRIELGEVEAALRGHAAVRGCLALVREDAPGDKRLVAYFTADDADPPTNDALRRHLREKLPEHMIPSAFVALEEFPLTANGKIDRRALPAPDDYLRPRENLYVAPRDETEEALAAIIRDVLGVERVGVYDDFFDLGGHSLLATQVITRVRDTLRVELPLKRFFEHPSVAELAASVGPLSRAGLVEDAPPVVPVPRDAALPLSFAQQRLWFLDQLEPGNAIYNLPTALRLRGSLDAEALRRTLNEIVRRHESLRTVFREERGEPVQVIVPEQSVEMPVLNLAGLPEAEREAEAERLSRAEAQKGFDLSRGPLLRATLLRLSAEDHLLLFTMHHIISDGWSVGVLVREAAALYEAYVLGAESPLPELQVQYADYAVWQREWLRGAALDEQLAYWKKQLDGAPALTEFPADHPRPSALTFRGAALNFELPAQLTEELRALGRREGVTLYMILLAAFQTLLSRHTGRQDIVVGSPIANRRRREIEPLIGFFVNTLVMRTDLSGDPSFRQLLGRVREVTLGAYAHQDIPFEMLVEELQPERSLGFTPLFQMMFVLQNAPGDELRLPGLALGRADVWSGTTHFDLTLQLEESARGLAGVVEYSVELFNEETIRSLTRRLETLLEGFAADPDATLSALPLFADAEEEQLLARRAAAGEGAQAPPAQTRGGEKKAYVAPRTAAEEILAGIWSDVLKVERVGVHDDFFDLGGHSLLATQLMSRVRNAFRIEVPLRRLFEHPNVADLARSIEASLRDGREPQAAPIDARPREGHLPLSFAQQRLWFIDQLQPGASTYHIPVALNIGGRLDAATLERSLAEIQRRHESLRTSFTVLDGQPVQVVAPDSGFTLPLLDLSGHPAAERDAELRRLSTEEAHTPFDLAQSPLWRARLLRMGGDEHVLLLTMHHIISDGWSSGVMVRELAALYEAYVRGEESPLEELGVQYGDYALWQREQMTGEALETQLAYWKNQLAGAPQMLELPTTRPRSVAKVFRGAREELTLSPQLTGWLKALSRGEGATLYMTLLAAFDVLLWRYSGQTDILVGSPIANRNRAETEPLIGFFVNTLVLRARVDERRSFRELLARVKDVCLGAYAHQDVPFEKLVEELQPERSLSRTPLFQVMFALQNAPMPVLKLDDLKLSLADIAGETAKFDLTLSLEESRGGLSGALEYNGDLFDAHAVRRMAGHYRRLLESIVENAGGPLSALTLLSAAERRQLLVEWNDTGRGDAPHACAHQLFERQAALTPEAAAVVSERGQMTYGELNRRANMLAHHLRGLGVGPETPVCICVERSAELLIGILAVAKAGGAYVPLDPSYPAQRLSFMLRDSRAPVLLTREGLRGLFEGCEAAPVLLDLDAEAIARRSPENPRGGVLPDNLAYVIYTSGSTGRPKGVQITHASLMNLVGWYRRTSHVAAGERVAQLSGVGFDASVFELWPNLTAGMTSYLPDEETRLAPEKLRDWLVSNRINACFAPTPLAELILTLEWPADAALRALYTGGDTLHQFPDASLPFQLVNSYGPTENTVIATSGRVTPEDARASHAPHIGRPVDNVEVYLLDRNMEPVPVGVRGELYVGGASLARGYANEPGLTAEAFIPNPFAAPPGSRLYRTGDAARYLHDGRIEFLGRLDYQVKIRGFRVELGEIEGALKRHADVREAAVVCDEVRPGEHRLTAYLALDAGAHPSLDKLRGYLTETLPEYMLPSAFVMLERLPLNANGKIDRSALPGGGGAHLAPDAAYVAPATELERVIAKLWQELLAVERVGIHDNFFDLGGHSLLIIRMRGRLQETLRREIAVVELFKYPTVSALARHLGGENGAREPEGVSPHRRRGEARRESAERRTRRPPKRPTL
ncbi:MAG TPA: amino acid adenylation domain-containing protein [Pyrinomonadaceae bacterium]|nr:amino acid adenylation domain-containing protein [Pyrinomonadaceae bacterium]